MLKILQASLQQYVNREFPDVEAGFRKGRRTRDQFANICWIIKKAREMKKKKKKKERNTSTSALLTMPRSLCGSPQSLENFSRDGNTSPPDLLLEKSVYR